jgi:hypothetical protein
MRGGARTKEFRDGKDYEQSAADPLNKHTFLWPTSDSGVIIANDLPRNLY